MTKKNLLEPILPYEEKRSFRSAFLYTPSSRSLNRKSQQRGQTVYPIDEIPEFHDPYSKLSLFLSSMVQKETQKPRQTKWSFKLQEELLQKITPEFAKKFPQYKLGIHALKKIWEKIQFYTEQLQENSEAIDEHGKLNVDFFIKENLKQYFQQKVSSFFNPYQFAYHVAAKVSECIATLEGRKAPISFLTKIIWSLQKHLLKNSPLDTLKPIHEELDQEDALIVKTVLATNVKHPKSTLQELEHFTKESLKNLHTLPSPSICTISALLAEKLYLSPSFHANFSLEDKEKVRSFLQRHIASSTYNNTTIVKRMKALYTLATNLPRDIPENLFNKAIEAAVNEHKTRPPLPEAIYAFISAELALLKKENSSYKRKTIWFAYQKALMLPKTPEEDTQITEVLIWKILSDTKKILEKLPYQYGNIIEEELASILIDNPLKPFAMIVEETLSFFQKAQKIMQDKHWKKSTEKVHLWCLQNDMLCSSIHLDISSPLAILIINKWKKSAPIFSHSLFVSSICQEYLKKFPSMSAYATHLRSKAWFFYKYLWFTKFGQENQCSFDRFILWHSLALQESGYNGASLLSELEKTCQKALPLMPFDLNHTLSLLSPEEKKGSYTG